MATAGRFKPPCGPSSDTVCPPTLDVGALNWRAAWYAEDENWIKPYDGLPVEEWTDWTGGGLSLTPRRDGPQMVRTSSRLNGRRGVRFDIGLDLGSSLFSEVAQPDSIVSQDTLAPSSGTAMYHKLVGASGDATTEFTVGNGAVGGSPAIINISVAWAELTPPPGLDIAPVVGGSGTGERTVSPVTGVNMAGVIGGGGYRADRPYVGPLGLAASSQGGATGSITWGALDPTAVVSDWPNAGIELASIHAPVDSQLSYEWDTAAAPSSRAYAANYLASGSQFSVVQDLPDPTTMATPSAGNLLIFTAWVGTATGSAPMVVDLDGWNSLHRDYVDPDHSPNKYLLVTYWKEADGTETAAEFDPVLIDTNDAHLLEIDGFAIAPVLRVHSGQEFTAESGWFPTSSVNWPDTPDGNAVFFTTVGCIPESRPASMEAAPWFERIPSSGNAATVWLTDTPLFGTPMAPVVTWLDEEGADAPASGATSFAVWVDAEPPVPPDPPSPLGSVRFDFCPKSIRALAIRLTRQNPSGATLDPLTPYSRIQSAGFAELGIDLDYDEGKETQVNSPSGTVPATIDKGTTILKGLELTLKLCGMPFSVLEMLCGIVPLDPSADLVRSAAWRDGFDPECKNPVMLELWSKNSGSTVCTEKWIRWLVPLTLDWKLTSGLNFSNGALDIELSGYGRQNAAWTPSFPGDDFPSWVPGSGDEEGWPVGPPGPILPPDVVADGWTLAEMAGVRGAGPIAYRLEEHLPEPLDDCDYIGIADCIPEHFTDDFCGAAGPVSSPWEMLPTFGDIGFSQILQRNGSCRVEMSEDFAQVGSIPTMSGLQCCDAECQTNAVSFAPVPMVDGGDSSVIAPYLFWLLDSDDLLLVTLFAFSDGVSAGVAISASLVGTDLDTVLGTAVVYASMPMAAYEGDEITLRSSWCGDGTVTIHVTGPGGFDYTTTVTGIFDLLPGVEVVRTGVLLAPLGDITMSPPTGFSLVCGGLTRGGETPLEPLDPVPVNCSFTLGAGLDTVITDQLQVIAGLTLDSPGAICNDAILTWQVAWRDAGSQFEDVAWDDPSWTTVAFGLTMPGGETTVPLPDGINPRMYQVVGLVNGIPRERIVYAVPGTFTTTDHSNVAVCGCPISDPLISWYYGVFADEEATTYTTRSLSVTLPA